MLTGTASMVQPPAENWGLLPEAFAQTVPQFLNGTAIPLDEEGNPLYYVNGTSLSFTPPLVPGQTPPAYVPNYDDYVPMFHEDEFTNRVTSTELSPNVWYDKGKNYDVIRDHNDQGDGFGSATWTSHFERIWSGSTWEDYILQDNNETVMYFSESTGSLFYDKNTCSYSTTSGGFNGIQLLDSVSVVPRYAVNGTDAWSTMPVNSQACDVDTKQIGDNVFITATKEIRGDIPSGQFYGNGTAIPPQTDVVLESFVQELRISPTSGIKETFQIFTAENERKLGVTQTIEAGETINIGGTVYDIASASGQIFPKEWLVANSAEVLGIASGLNYDIDQGIERLNAVRIIDDNGVYKVALDYQDSTGAENYLEIDPTLTTTSTFGGYVSTNGDCSANFDYWSTNNNEIFAGLQPNSSSCYRGIMEWDTSGIQDDSTITDVDVQLTLTDIITSGGWSAANADLTSVTTGQPSTLTGSSSDRDALGDDIGDGPVYVSNTVVNSVGTDYSWDLGDTANSDLQGLLSADWFALGGKLYDEGDTGGNFALGATNYSGHIRELTVEYTIPSVPTAPTSFTVQHGNPIELDWGLPTDDGGTGSGITGYKVYRTPHVTGGLALPDNQGSDVGIDMGDNELLLHLDSMSTGAAFSDDMDSDSGWIEVGSGFSFENGKLTATDIVLNDYNRIHKPIGTTLSDDKWFLQSKITIQAPSNNNGYVYPLVISNGNGDFKQNTNIDMIFFLVDSGNVAAYFRSQDGTTQSSVGSITWGGGNTFWVDIIRDGSTMTMKQWASEADQIAQGTPVSSNSFTISGSVTGLDTVQSGASSFNIATQSYTVDWVKIYDGVTSLPTPTLPDTSGNEITVSGTGTVTTGVIGTGAVTDPNLTFVSTDTDSTIGVTWDASTCVGCSVNGDTVTATATGWYTGIARATETISASVGGTLTFSSTSPNTQAAPGTNTMIGLGAGALNNGAGGKVWHDIEYGFTDQEIIENGSQLSPDTAFTRADSDVLKIVMTSSGGVTYFINDVLVHTSTNAASGDYYPLFTSYETGETMTAPYATIEPIISGTDPLTVAGWYQRTPFPSGDVSGTWSSNGLTNNIGCTVDDEAEFSMVGGSWNKNRCWVDLGSVDDTQWVLRFKLDFNSFSSIGSNSHIKIWLDDDTALGGDALGFYWNFNTNGGSGLYNGMYPYANDGSSDNFATTEHNGGDPINGQNNPASSTYVGYFEMKRTGTDQMVLTEFSDSNYSQQVASGTIEGGDTNAFGASWNLSSPLQDLVGITDLQYLHFGLTGVDSSGGTWELNIDDILFYDGVSSATPPEEPTEFLKVNGVSFNIDKTTASVTAQDTTTVELTPSLDGYEQDTNRDNDCADAGADQPTDSNLRARAQSASIDCEVGYIEWDTSSISDSATVTKVELKMDIQQSALNGRGCEINALTIQPSGNTGVGWNTFFADMQDGAYIQDDPQCDTVQDNVVFDLGADAVTDLSNLLSSDWFGVGLWLDDGTINNNQYYWFPYSSEGAAANSKTAPTLIVTTCSSCSTLGSVTIDDSTTANKHYAFTRSGNTWTVFQDGVSKGTFSDATSLGTGTEYSMNIGGTVDEYAIFDAAESSSTITEMFDRVGSGGANIPTTEATLVAGTPLPDNTNEEEILLHWDSIQGVDATGLRGWWEFEEGGGGSIDHSQPIFGSCNTTESTDCIYENNNIEGSALSVAGPSSDTGYAIDFDGDSWAYGYTEHWRWSFLTKASEVTDFTLNTWIKMNELQSGSSLRQFIMGNTLDSSSAGWGFQMFIEGGSASSGNEGKVNFQLFNAVGGGSCVPDAYSTSAITDTDWHMVTVQRDIQSGNDDYLFFIDGVYDGTFTASCDTYTTNNPNAEMFFGKSASGSTGWYLDGALDDLSIWSRQLTAAELSSLYNAGNPYDMSVIDTPQTSGTSIAIAPETGTVGDGSFNKRVTDGSFQLTTTALPDNTDDWTIAGWFASPTSGVGDKTIWRLNDVAVQIGQETIVDSITNSDGNTIGENQSGHCCGNIVAHTTWTSGAYEKFGLKVASGSALEGVTVDRWDWYLGRNGSPDGTLYTRVYDEDKTTLLFTFGSLHPTNDISTSMGWEQFYTAGQAYTLEAGDIVVLEIVGMTELSNSYSPRIDMGYHNSQVYDGTNTYSVEFDSPTDTWAELTGEDPRFRTYSGAILVTSDVGSAEVVGITTTSVGPTTLSLDSSRTIEDKDNNNQCDPSGNYDDSTGQSYMTRIRSTGNSEDCQYTGFEFDLSGVPAGSVITSSKFQFDVNQATSVNESCDYIGMDVQPSTASAGAVFQSIHESGMTGTELVASDAECKSTGNNKEVNLGSAGNTYLTSQIADGWAGIGVRYDDMTLDSSVHYTGHDNAGTPPPQLVIEYDSYSSTPIVQATGLDGLTSEGIVDVTSSDDFATDNMLDQDSSAMGVSGGVVSVLLWRDGSNDSTSLELDSTYGNEFVMQHKYKITNSGSSGAQALTALNSEDSTFDFEDDHQNWVGWYHNDHWKIAPSIGVDCTVYNCPALGSGTSQQGSWYTMSQNTEYFVEVIGNGDDTFTFNIRTGSHTGTVVDTQTLTQAGITGLDHWKIGNPVYSGYSGGTALEFDDFSVVGPAASQLGTEHHYAFTRDGNTWSVYQDGQLEATATSTQSMGSNDFVGSIPDEDFDFAYPNTGWVQTGGKVAFPNSAGAAAEMSVDAQRDCSVHGAVYDLGSPLSSTWAMRFQYDLQDWDWQGGPSSGSDRIGIALRDTNNADMYTQQCGGSGTNYDYLGLIWINHNSGSNDKWGSAYAEATPSGAQGMGIVNDFDPVILDITQQAGQGIMYIEMIRTGTNEYTVEMFSDATFSTTIGTKQTVSMGSVNPSNLQYLVVNIANDTSDNSYNLTFKVDNMKIYDGITTITPMTQASYIFDFAGTADEFVVKDTADTASEVLAAYEMADFTKYTDSNVVGGDSFYYYTTALNSLGEGDATSTLFGSASVVPGAPTNLAGVTGMPIELSWTAASNTYASTPITHYSIERSTDGGNTWSLACVACDDIGNVLVYSDNNVSGGTTYDYRVFAHNLIGSGPASNTESTQAGVAPDPPTGVTTQIQNPNTDPKEIRVSWTSPTNVGTGTLSNFEVWRDDGSGYSLITTTGLVNLYDDTVPSDNISPGYTYKVRAVSNHGTSTDSNTSNIGTPGVPLAVTNLATAQTQTEKIVLTWTASAGFVPVNHEIYRDDGSGAVKIDTIGNVLTYTNNLLSSEAGDTFTYHVVATNAAGSSPDSNTSQITAWDVPAAPVLSGQAGVPIVLSWTTPASDDTITGYKIYKDGTLLTSVGVVTTYSDSAVSGGVTYSYEVSAVSATGEGTKSSAVSVIGGTAPGAPTGLTVTVVAGQLDLSWSAPGNNGGVAISGYKIERSTDNANWTDLVANTGSTVTTYSDTTTTDGTTYYYKISAINSVGTGSASNTASGLAGDVPDAPAAPTVTAIAGSDITIAWTTPDGNGYAVSKEEIHYSTDGGSTWNILIQDLTTPSHTDPNLTNGQTYHYKTKSYNALGWSAFSASANAMAGDIPDALASITITALPGSEIKLDWSAPADNSYAISGYEIKRSTDGGTTFSALTTVNALTHTDSSLTNGATYHYKIYPVNALGTQTSSPTVNEKAGDVPGNVTNFTATSISATEIDLSWTASDANGYTVSYKIEVSPDNTTWTTEVASQSGVTYSDTGLTEDTTYYYRIIPSNALGNGATSSVVNAATFGKPSPPASVTVTTASTTGLDLSWTASAGNGYAITGYKIEQTADGGTTWTTVVADTGNTNLTYSVTSLNSNSEYSYRIYGISSYGTSATASTPQAGVTLPDGPTNLVLTVIDDASIKLDWTAPSGSVALTYKVERETAGTWGDVQTGVSAVTFTDTGLSAVTEYTYRVSATNTGGYGTTSNEESATTFGVPDQPSAPTLTALAGSEIKIDWTAPADNGEVITNYKVEKSTDGTTWALLTTVSGSTLTHTDTGLTNGSTYYYRIIAVNAIGDSPASAATTAVAGDVPSKPATPVLTAQAGSQIKVDWTAPASNGYAITSYTLEHSTDGTTWTTETTGNFLTYTDTQLTNASTHYYRVTATNGIGDSVVSDSVSVVAGDVPNVPTNLVITPSPLAASLTWSAPNNNGYAISTYLVERATDGVTFTTVGTPATTSFGDTNLTVGTTYTYRISATNALGTGTAVSGTVLGGDVPGTPALSVTSDGIATWTAPADNSYAITGYNVYLDGTLITTTTGLTYTYTGLSSGTAYTSDVKAVNSLGESASSQQTFTTVPDAVTNLAFSAASTTAINLSWTAPSGLVSSYTIERDGGVIATGITVTQYSDTSGLQPTSGYVYDVIAINAGGQSAKATVTAATLPSAPTNVVAQAQSDTAITLTWTNPTGGPTALDGFKIERSLDAGTTWSTLVADTGNVNNQYVDSSLTPLTTYHYRLYSLNLGGTSGVSGTVNEETFGPPDAIADLGSTVTPSAINLSWSVPDANGATITSYMVEVISISTGNWITLDSNVNTNSYTHSVLIADTEYSFRVTSTNLYGTSGVSNTHAVYSLPSAPAAPTLTGNTDVVISWTTASGLSYRLETSTDQTTWSTLSTTQPYTHSGINPGTTVYYRLFAINTSGDSSPSATVSVTTLGMPNAPTNLTFTNPTPMSVLLDWDAPTTGGTVDSYKVQFSTDNFVADVQTLVTGHTTTTYTYTSTTYSAPHYFRIISTNGQGDSSPTNSVTYTTPDLPTAPASLTGEPKQQNTAILLDWNAPSNTYGYAISGYMIERNVNGGGWQTTVTNTQSSTTAYTQTSLTEGLTYQYRVSAITAVGTGPSSNTVTVDLYESSSSVSGSAVGGNTVTITPVLDNSNVGQPSSSVPDINTVKLYENNAKIDEVGYNNLPLANGPHTFNDFYAYPDATSDYYVVIDLSNGDTIQSNTISLTPSNPFAGEFTLLEQRTIYDIEADCLSAGGVWVSQTASCTLDYDESELNLLVQPMGSDVLIKWQSQDVTEDPIIKSFTNVQGNITTVVDLPDPDKDYYVSVYIQPEFQYTEDGSGNALIPCELDSEGNKLISTCVDDDIPTGYRSDKAVKSVSDPAGPANIGIENMAPSGMFGMPLVFIFIVGLAAVFTGRSAQMGSVFILITIGVMAYLGYISFDFGDQSNAITWALMIFVAIVGVLIGKRWS